MQRLERIGRRRAAFGLDCCAPRRSASCMQVTGHAGNRPSICARPDQLMGNINGSFGKGCPLSSDVNTNVIDARVAILCSSREVAKTALPNTPNWKGNTSAKDSVGAGAQQWLTKSCQGCISAELMWFFRRKKQHFRAVARRAGSMFLCGPQR